MNKRTLEKTEAAVIAAAVEWAWACEGAKYGPMAEQVKKAEAALLDAVSDLASECDGEAWRNPYE